MVLNIDFFRPSDDPDAIGPDQVRRMLAIPTRIQERHAPRAHSYEFTFLSWAVWSPPTRVSLLGMPAFPVGGGLAARFLDSSVASSLT
jgi:hypothetical protein